MNYELKDVYVLCTINVTDKVFGELIINMNEFRGLPECKEIRELQYRVVAKSTRK
mgnify:FL=1